MGLVSLEGATHDHRRHGTTTLFAALEVLAGAVPATCKPRLRPPELPSFLREIDKAVPAELNVRCIAGNDATHNHPEIKAWLAARPCGHMHFIPTHKSWLDQVECFFSPIADKATHRGSRTSVRQLTQRIDHFVTKPSRERPNVLVDHRCRLGPRKSCIDFAHVSAGRTMGAEYGRRFDSRSESSIKTQCSEQWPTPGRDPFSLAVTKNTRYINIGCAHVAARCASPTRQPEPARW